MVLQAKPRLCGGNGVRKCDNTAGWMCAVDCWLRSQWLRLWLHAGRDVVDPAAASPHVASGLKALDATECAGSCGCRLVHRTVQPGVPLSTWHGSSSSSCRVCARLSTSSVSTDITASTTSCIDRDIVFAQRSPRSRRSVGVTMALLFRILTANSARPCGDVLANIRPLVSLTTFASCIQPPSHTHNQSPASSACCYRQNSTATCVNHAASAPPACSWMQVSSFAPHARPQSDSGSPSTGHVYCIQQSTPAIAAWRSAAGAQQGGANPQSQTAQRIAPRQLNLRGLAEHASAAADSRSDDAQRAADAASRPRRSNADSAPDADQKQVLYRGKVR